MSDQYIDYGNPLPNIDPKLLTHQESKNLLAACQQIQSCVDIIELRSIQHKHTIEDIIIVDFGDGSVPSRNSVGINVRERLAITYRPRTENNLYPYDVRALRNNFPTTPHQNHVLQGEPKSLCLYFEPWSTLERNWTPQTHLKRINWWLSKTAQNTLHREDQPLEQLYFSSPWKIILPPDFHERVKSTNDRLLLSYLSPDDNPLEVIIDGQFVQKNIKQKNIECLTVVLPPVESGRVEEYPYTLGALYQQLLPKEADVFKQLSTAILNKEKSSELYVTSPTQKSFTFILLSIPRVRSTHGPIEYFDTQGFIINEGIAEIGISMGVLFKDLESLKVYRDTSIGSEKFPQTKVNWKNIPIFPVDVKLRSSKNYAREASGIADNYSEFSGILAGVGALGSCLAEIWSKEAWGNWTYIDDDILEPHNTIRHLGRDAHIGLPKVEAVREMTGLNYANGLKNPQAIRAKINDPNSQDVQSSIKQADLLVDITTTLEAPHDLSTLQESPRMVSAFVTPSGRDSVILFEDKQHLIKLPSLEAQYYRAILQSTWGNTHLLGYNNNLWVGAGCRNASTIMSNELIQLHGAILARQIRKHYQEPEAKINIWVNDDDTGGVTAIDIPVHATITNQCSEWSVCWDMGLQEKLLNMRKQSLPNETGGILLGYLDQKIKIIHLVDALPAPLDSVSESDEFTRGERGVKDALKESEAKTTGIVTYIGEWHSHPPNTSVNPSCPDIKLLAALTEQMSTDGLPFVMLIAGESKVSCSLGQASY